MILVAFLFIILSFSGASQISMESGTDTFVEKTSQLYQDYDHLFLNIFYTQSMVVLVENGDVTDPELLKAVDRLEYLSNSIEGVVETSSIASVIKETNFQTSGRYAIPDEQTQIDDLLLIAGPQSLMPDKQHTVIFVKAAGDTNENTLREILREVEFAAEFADFPPEYRVIVTGDPAFNVAMEDEMNASMGPLLLLSAILMIIVLYLVFRHVRWRLLPLAIVFLGIIYTFGVMGYVRIPMSMVSMSAFPILVGLGIDYAIQFHNRIEEELDKGESESKAVTETIKHTGPAVFIALIITSLGFVSLFTSSVPMIQDFGKLLLIGIFMCFLASLFVGVTLIYGLDVLGKKNRIYRKLASLKPSISIRKRKEANSKNEVDSLEKLIEKTTMTTIKHPGIVLFLAVSLCMAGFYTDSLVPIQTDMKTFVPTDMPALVDWNHMADVLGGGVYLNLIIKVDDTADPDVLHWMDRFSEHETEARSDIYGADSIVPIVKEMNGGTIPDNRNDIQAIYDQLPEDVRNRYIYSNSMLLLNLDIGNAWEGLGIKGMEELVNIVRTDVMWMPPPPDVSVTITGDTVTFTEVISALTTGRVAMTMLGLFMVFGGLIVIYRDWLKAFTPVITMLMVIGWAGGIMYIMGIEYTPMTATLGALILGVGSEYAVLMMERYFEEKEKGHTPIEAMREASKKIGKAIITSGLTTLFGFSALIASPFSMNSNFGMVTVIDVALALLATFIVFPPVLVYLDTWRDRRLGRIIPETNEVY
ncbi:hydrophobe/amphiphile efflux-3 (HAE3) family transporter [Methanococcoides sp. AM1]|uniref:hydrophobe/amphiphile efflux-3 (HAE3) family transporter n=1 Tax=Methanococcoides sp. AM1 TaxID=1201011 RepID=UPI00352A4C06